MLRSKRMGADVTCRSRPIERKWSLDRENPLSESALAAGLRSPRVSLQFRDMRRSAFAFIFTAAAIGSVGTAVYAAEPKPAEPKTWEYGGGGQWPLVEAPKSAQ